MKIAVIAPFNVLIVAIGGSISLSNKDCSHQNNEQIVFYNITDTVIPTWFKCSLFQRSIKP